MISEDEYITLKGRSEGLYKDRGSKFIAVAAPVGSAEEALSFIEEIRKEYHDARHHCFAYMIGIDGSEWRVNDDGEPTGSAGFPILGQIRSFNLSNVVIVVVRYFGGTLLGVGGLINAYRSSARDALESAKIVTRQLKETFIIEFPYSSMNSVMTLVKDNKLEQINQIFELECTLTISLRKSMASSVISSLEAIDGVICKQFSD